MKGVVTVCLIVLTAASVSAAAAEMELNVYKAFSPFDHEYRYDGSLSVYVGADTVQARMPSSSEFEPLDYDGDDEWWLGSDELMTLPELQDVMAGAWTLRIIVDGNTYDYDFNVAAVQDEDFLPVPSVTSPSWDEDIPQSYNFTWDNNDAHLLGDGYMTWLEVGDWEIEDGWMKDGSSGSMDQDAEEWFVSDIPLGEAHFGIGYGVFKELISDMEGPVGAPAMDYWSVVISADGLQFAVVPEPMTLSIVGIGAVALLRRRR